MLKYCQCLGKWGEGEDEGSLHERVRRLGRGNSIDPSKCFFF